MKQFSITPHVSELHDGIIAQHLKNLLVLSGKDNDPFAIGGDVPYGQHATPFHNTHPVVWLYSDGRPCPILLDNCDHEAQLKYAGALIVTRTVNLNLGRFMRDIQDLRKKLNLFSYDVLEILHFPFGSLVMSPVAIENINELIKSKNAPDDETIVKSHFEFVFDQSTSNHDKLIAKQFIDAFFKNLIGKYRTRANLKVDPDFVNFNICLDL